jgi:hypothetical protein
MDDSPFSTGSASLSPYDFPEGNPALQGMASTNSFRGVGGSRPSSASSFGSESGIPPTNMMQNQMNSQQYQDGTNMQMGGQHQWSHNKQINMGGAQPPFTGSNPGRPNPNYPGDHFLGEGRSASTVAPHTATTKSSDVDRDPALTKGGMTGNEVKSKDNLASSPNIFKNSPLTNKKGNDAIATSGSTSASSFLAQLAAKKDTSPPLRKPEVTPQPEAKAGRVNAVGPSVGGFQVNSKIKQAMTKVLTRPLTACGKSSSGWPLCWP